MPGYTKVFTAPYARHLIVGNLIGRLPNGMGVLAIVLFLRAHGVGYQAIGVLVGVYALASAIGGPLLGRAVDKRGQPVVLTAAALGSGTGFALLALSAVQNLAVTVAGVVLAGLFTPPLEPCLRSLWPSLLAGKEAVAAAYALDAALQEAIFVVGPLLVINLVGLIGDEGALWATGLVAVTGTLIFVAAPPVRSWRAEIRTPGWAGPLSSGPLRVLLLSLLLVGTAIGVLSIAAVSYSEHVHRPDVAGYLLAANALGALMGGLIYGFRRWPGKIRAQLVWLLGALALGYWPLVSVTAPVGMVLLGLLSGVFLAPVLACAFVIVGEATPQGTVTEAFAWVVTIFVVGTSLGSTAAGITAQYLGLRAAFLLPGLAATAAAVCVTLSPEFRLPGWRSR